MSYETPRVKERSKELALMSNILAVTIVVALVSTFIFVCAQVHKMNQQIAQMEVSIAEMRADLDQLEESVKQLQKRADELDARVTQLEKRVDQLEAASKELTPTYTFASATERDYVERVVEAESCGESQEGQMYVAMCIKNTAIHKGISALAVVSTKGQYTSPASTASASVKEAVEKVFDQGYAVTNEPVMYFYSTCNDGYSS